MTRTPAKERAGTSGPSHSNPCLVPELASGPATIRMFHAIAPNCWWSWGYMATLARVRLVYGNQVDIRLGLSPVYTDMKKWLAHNGLDRRGWGEWAKKSAKVMGVPIFTGYQKVDWADDSSPAVEASVAAFRQGQPQGERFVRALLRRSIVEGRDAASETEIRSAATEAGLDARRFEKDRGDASGLAAEQEEMSKDMPHDVATGFYNLILEDNRGRKMVLNHAFDPAAVVEAIEFLSGGRLVKNQPTDPIEYLAATGAAPTSELARAFGVPEMEIQKRLATLAASGRVRKLTMADGEHWEAVSPA